MIFLPIPYTEVYVFGICLSVNIRVVTLIRVSRSMPDVNITREYQLLFGPCISTFLRELGLCLKSDMECPFPVDAVCLSRVQGARLECSN